jgi:hypothetical protein
VRGKYRCLVSSGRVQRIQDWKYARNRLRILGCHRSGAGKMNTIAEAVERAKTFVSYAIEYALPIEKENDPVNLTSWILIPAEKLDVIESIRGALLCLNHLRS